MYKKILLIINLILVSCNINSQILKYSNDFLNIGVNASDIALGGSVFATNSNISAAYYNPASLININNNYEASIMHAQYYSGIAKFDYGAFGFKLSDSSFISFSMVRYGIDNIQNTLFLIDENGNLNYDKITYFSVADYAFWGSYAQKTNIRGLSIGGSFFIIYRHLGSFAKGYGFRADIAVNYKIKKWQIGVVLTNATTSYTAWFVSIDEQMKHIFEQTNNEIPKNSIEITTPQLNTGIGKNFVLSKKLSFRSEISFNITFDGKRNSLIKFGFMNIYPQTGIELSISNTFFIRGGVKNFQFSPKFIPKDSTNNNNSQQRIDFVPSLGLGFHYKGFVFDYAFTNFINGSSDFYSHIISVGLKF